MKTTMKFKQLSLCLLALSLTSFVTGCIEKSQSSSTTSPTISSKPIVTEPSVTSQQSPASDTVFKCEQEQDNLNRYVTIAMKPSNKENYAVLFIWSTKEFGNNWQPDKRCYEVTNRLNRIVSNNGGSLADLNLGFSEISGENVICIKKDIKELCNNDNMLVTLNKENAKSPQEAITKLSEVAQGKVAYNPLYESCNNNSCAEVVSFKKLIDDAFRHRSKKIEDNSFAKPKNIRI